MIWRVGVRNDSDRKNTTLPIYQGFRDDQQPLNNSQKAGKRPLNQLCLYETLRQETAGQQSQYTQKTVHIFTDINN